MPVGIQIKLHHCKKCNTMSNHSKKTYYVPKKRVEWECLRCKIVSQDKSESKTVKDLHGTRLELMKEAKEKGMDYESYVKWKDAEAHEGEEK